jgi:sugar lactone lactonase YvrE
MPAPRFQVDPFWPRQLPNRWIMSQVAGIFVDARDHVWVVQRPSRNTADEIGAALDPPLAECCYPAPPVIEFDVEGNVLSAWGGPGKGYDWPEVEHSICVDRSGHVWISGTGPRDRHALKFTGEGEFVLQIGRPSTDPVDSNRTDILGQASGFAIDEEAREIYIADGYMNRRVIVFDCDDGTFKRLWGAYGGRPDDTPLGRYDPSAPPAGQFRNPVHSVQIARDGRVYVCDRANDRIQIFSKSGEFERELFIVPTTIGHFTSEVLANSGSTWDLVFSHDEAQTYMFVADGTNNVIWTVRRSDGEILGKTGHPGRNAGQFHWLHSMAADSAGNLYTGEVDTGKRLQKFTEDRT